MFNKEKSYLGVSLSEDALKIVHLRVSSSEQKMLNVYRKNIQEVSEEELPKIIQIALSELNAKKTNPICVLPSNVITTNNIEIPSLDPAEIKSIIDLQAGRHTPYSREEILIGYITIGEFQRNYTQVLLIIVNRNVIKKQIDIFNKAGLKIQKVLFASEGMARFYCKILNLKPQDRPFGIVDIGKKATNFIVSFNHTAIMCRHIPIGMENLLKEGQESRDKLTAELVSSIESYQSEDINKIPDTYYLTSDDTKIKELEPLFREKFKANVKMMPYLDHVKADQPIMLKLVSEFDDDSFLDLIASVVSAGEVQIDLLPEEVKHQRAIEDQARQLVLSGSFAIVILLLICAIFLSKIYFHSIYLSKLTAEYEKKHADVDRLEKIAQNTRIIKEYVDSRMVSLDVLNELYRYIPDEIYLKSVLMDEDGIISIEGTSDTMSLVFNLVSSLEDSELFKGVKTKSTAAKKERGKDVAAFEITFRLESAPDEPEPTEKPEEVKQAKAAAPVENAENKEKK